MRARLEQTGGREGRSKEGEKKKSRSVVEVGIALVDRVCKRLRLHRRPTHHRRQSSRGCANGKGGQGERKEGKMQGDERWGDQEAVVVGETEGGLMTPIGCVFESCA